MLIYLIIAAELAILYTVFWYVYVRDPKPYKIVGNLWGKYGDSSITTGGADPTLPFAVEAQINPTELWQAQGHTAFEPYPKDVAYSNGSQFERPNALQYRRLMHKRTQLHRFTPDQCDQSKEQENVFISRVLGMFSRTLDAFNVKVP